MDELPGCQTPLHMTQQCGKLTISTLIQISVSTAQAFAQGWTYNRQWWTKAIGADLGQFLASRSMIASLIDSSYLT